LATVGLGELALTSGNKKQASVYFSQAASAGGDYGKQAREQLARLELPDNPQKYLAVKHALSREGDVLAIIENRSSIDVIAIEVETSILNLSGEVIEKKRWLSEVAVGAGKQSIPLKDPIANPLESGFKVRGQVIKAQAK
jgi:hypothetical protein